MPPGGSYIGELPGMIWDAAKCRYIKAQPSHIATDAQKQVERRKKEDEERDRQAAAFLRAKNQTIVRRTTLHDTMDIPTGGSHVDNVRQFTPSIHRKGVAMALKGTTFPPNLQDQLLIDNVSIHLFDYHEPSGTFVFGIHLPYTTVLEGSLVSARPRSPSQRSNPSLPYEVSPLVIDLPRTGFSSLQITPNSNIIATTYGSGEQRPQVLIIPATNDGSLSIASDIYCPYVNHTMNDFGTIWSCAVNPWASSGIGSTSGETVAIGSSGRYLHYRLTNDSSLRHVGVHATGCDIRAVEWKDINVTAGGAHNGKVYFFDVRSRKGTLRLETVRHSINGIRFTGTDNHHMVLNGINNFMVMYDLRFPGTMLESRTNPPTKPKPSVVYPYRNPSHYPTAFDISTSLDLVAAAESDVPGIVQVYRLSTGQKLRALDVRPLSGVANGLHIPHCLRFKRDSTGVPMLLIAAGKNVAKFAV